MLISYLKKAIPDRHPLRLLYHKFMAALACLRYGFPASQLQVIGVTGTKGKTTTSNLIATILTEAGYKVGMTSTINFQVGNLKWINETKITTLNPFFLQKMLRKMVDEQCKYAVLEVSSHSLIQNRIWGINFDTAVLTNVGEDHLEYHGGFQNYLRAKGMLFERLNKSKRKPRVQKVSIINHDDNNFAYFDQFLADRKYTYGLKSGTCFANNIQYQQTGVHFTLNIPNNKTEIDFKLPGEFNVYNALAATTVALANGINLQVVKTALEKAATISGRYEQIDCGQGFAVIVDYAHTAESLAKLLELYKNQTPGRLLVVFGATGGGRDKAKRPKMGEAADRFAHMIVLTDDDPYEEKRLNIIDEVATGIKRSEGVNFWKIPSRYEAIRFVLNLAQENDTVVVAGKGAEQVQMIDGQKVPWDDRKVIREILSQAYSVEL